MANFNFKSPSVKFQEIDRSFASTPSLGITSVGIVGETLKGPAFSPVLVTTKAEFRRYFGGTSTEKYPDGSGKMKFLAPTYANSFLEEGNQLYVTRILGKSGYNAGPGWAIRVGTPFTESGLTNTTSAVSYTVSSSTVFGVTGVTANGNYISELVFNNGTGQTVAFTVSGYNATNTVIPSTSGLVLTTVQNNLIFTGNSVLGIVVSSATASTGTSFFQGVSFLFDSGSSVFVGTQKYVSVSGYNSIAVTGRTNYTSFTYTAQSTTVISGIGAYIINSYSAASTNKYENMVVAILRSRGSGLLSNALFNVSAITGDFSNTEGSPLSNFTITAVGATTEVLDFNLNSTSSSFITKAMGRKNSDTKASVWCEAIYPDLIRKLALDDKISYIKDIIPLNTNGGFSSTYETQYKTPETPWIVSELNGNKISRLFKFISFSDGDSANKEVKIAIENVNFSTLEFDIVVRDYNDTDANPSILERFGRCVMNPNSNNFVMRRIGGVYSDAEDAFLEDAKSAYIYINVSVNAPITSIPAGFEGYQLPLFNEDTMDNPGYSAATPIILYKTGYTATDKPLKTYLGISEKAYDSAANTRGLSINDDFFKFYGLGTNSYKTKGFHFDQNATGSYGTIGTTEYIGEFEVGADTFNSTGSYANITTRKFVVVPYGGFDGWDVNYEAQNGRSITNAFGQGGIDEFDESDYNAYLEAYQVYEDTERTPINLFSTPGINWGDNLSLVENVVEIVEEIRQDALYIIDAPDVSDINDTPTVAAGDYADLLDATGIDSSYAATYVPWVRRKDPDSNTNIYIPPTGEILKAMALADRTSFIWFATAGLNRGGLPNARDVRKTFKESDRDTLYLSRLNPIVKFSNNTPGIFIYGQKTLQIADSKLDRIDVRRLLLYAKQIISSQARLYLFEPNDDVLATNFIAESNKKLKVIQDNRGLQTFKVRLDNTLNTPESRDRNEIYFVIDLLPIGAVEFIGLTFVVNKSTSSLSFNG
jgi:hypothetical protein